MTSTKMIDLENSSRIKAKSLKRQKIILMTFFVIVSTNAILPVWFQRKFGKDSGNFYVVRILKILERLPLNSED